MLIRDFNLLTTLNSRIDRFLECYIKNRFVIKLFEMYTVRNNFRCGIGKNRCGIGIFPLRAFPIPHRKLFLTV
jgi:hypothetical protein